LGGQSKSKKSKLRRVGCSVSLATAVRASRSVPGDGVTRVAGLKVWRSGASVVNCSRGWKWEVVKPARGGGVVHV
jgi:hypothetical protein